MKPFPNFRSLGEAHCRTRHDPPRARGFTLLELIMIVAIIGVATLMLIPNLNMAIRRAKALGFARNASALIQQARQESIRRNTPVVLRADFANNQFIAFANVDNDAGFLFQPVAGSLARTTDYLVGGSSLPVVGTGDANLLEFWGATDPAPHGATAIDGFTLDGNGERVGVLMPDGSIVDVGAFRLGDQLGNFFELRVAPAATARVELRKYHPSPAFGPAGFYPAGLDPTTGQNLWEWFG